jgi:hypothetical protein
MERNIEACLCTHPQGKPIVHNENPKKSQVSFGSMFFYFLLDNCYCCTRSNLFVLSVTVKSKGSLGYCFLRGESGGLELEIKLNSQELGQSFRCLWRILGREC